MAGSRICLVTSVRHQSLRADGCEQDCAAWRRTTLLAVLGCGRERCAALVNKVVQHLRDQAFLEHLPNRGFRVRDHEGLLQAWRTAYRFARHSRRPYFSLLQGRALRDRLQALDPAGEGRLAYAAFSAADLQAPTVRQPRTWLYLDPNVEQEFQSAAEAKPVDSGENLIVLIPDDAGVFYRVESGRNRLACTNAVQTYVDLAHAGGRGEEAAEAILNQRLKPAWSSAIR
jgi:transcriptional regulator with AbiEi antitoxin domain of type IV toxin-antitoxin system